MSSIGRTGAPALVVAIMVMASICPWIAIPLGCLWLGSIAEGATESVGVGFGVALGCAVALVFVLVRLLLWLSNVYRDSRIARGLRDNGHELLETVLILGAAVAVSAFGVWFLLFAGADPMPLGINI